MSVKETLEYQAFIKPVGAKCNLRCSYCYYNSSANDIGGTRGAIMSETVLEEYVKQNIAAAGSGPVFFAWHGGEPTLAGKDFYRKAVELQKKYQPEGVGIINGLQTNGTLIDDEWCIFLAENRFAVGISIDGPENLHNKNRRSPSGTGSFASAAGAFQRLKKYGLEPEILCVVSSTNADYPLDLYRYFRELGARWITFLPLVIRDTDSKHGVLPPSVNSRRFGEFLCALFDEWVEHDIGLIKIQIIEEATRVAFNQEHTLCIFKRECGGVPVIEINGDFYSCDHYVNDEQRIGNIMETPLAELLCSDRQRAFGLAKRNTLPQYCLSCDVLQMCNGECPKNRFVTTPSGEPGLNYLCEGYRLFFKHMRPFIDAVREADKR
jgi:uncharacterized protein